MVAGRVSTPMRYWDGFSHLIVISGLLTCGALSIPWNSLAATARGSASLVLRVEPAAIMTTSLVISADESTSGGNALLRVDLTVRVNPGTTASVRLYPASGDPPAVLLTVSQSGRYSITVGVPSVAGSAPSSKTRVELQSSDQALFISKTL